MPEASTQAIADRRQSTPAKQPYATGTDEVLALWRVEPQVGLPEERVALLREQFGENRLAEAPRTPTWKRFLGQFTDLVIWILIVAAVISGLLGEWIDAGAILAIVLLNGVLGFLQEERAERSLAALQRLSAPQCKVVRDGRLRSLEARELVPGDWVELEAGDRIPADLRLAETYEFQVQEAALTGESLPVAKRAQSALPESTPLGDRRNMAYLGTVATSGKAAGVVVATGMNTELGRIAGLLMATEREPTPLQRRLAELGRVLVVVCLAMVGLIFIVELLQEPVLHDLLLSGRFLEALRSEQLVGVFLVAVSLAVAAVPEGLPAVVTLALALGLQRMVRRNALIRRLPSVETLGAVTVICSDKTGTLTRNEMTVREIVTAGSRFQVTGAGYVPEGEFLRIEPGHPPSDEAAVSPGEEADLQQLLEIASWCNNARVVPAETDGAWQVIGDPTEGALLVAARKAGIDASGLRGEKVYELPFDSERKAMSVVVREDGRTVMHTKGAPEAILARCVAELRDGRVVPLDEERRRKFENANTEMASRALRVLAFASKDVRPDSDEYTEDRLIFVGLSGMIDPPREEVKAAVQTCRTAGIRPVMITGDHPATALAIARELQLVTGDGRVLTGQDLNRLTEKELAEQVDEISVYARVSAEHKLRVVRAWKARGQTVAMTGDGVNDAPAVKAADIGIAMGITGTDVTKEASAMVLMDDNFASIVSAVEEGRCIYDNIRKVLQFLLSCNAGEILLMLVAGLLGWPVPLLPIHILWVNLVTDGLPALALSMEPPEPGLMQRPPRRANESMLTFHTGLQIVLQGLLIGAAVLGAFWLVWQNNPVHLRAAQTTAFCVLVFSEFLRAFAARSSRLTALALGLFTNKPLLAAVAASALLQVAIVTLPGLRHVFEAPIHSAFEWLLIVLLALMPVTLIETAKVVRGLLRRDRRHAPPVGH